MNLIDKLAKPPASNNTFDAWISTLTPEEQEAVHNAATDSRWGHKAMFDVLLEYGMPDAWATREAGPKALGKWRIARGWTK